MFVDGKILTTPIRDRVSPGPLGVGAYRECTNLGDDPETQNLTAMDPEILKHELVGMLMEQAVKLLLHTYIVQSIVEDNVIKGVIIENKAGRQAIADLLGR